MPTMLFTVYMALDQESAIAEAREQFWQMRNSHLYTITKAEAQKKGTNSTRYPWDGSWNVLITYEKMPEEGIPF